MKILIATGIFPPEVGGPATYAKHLALEFAKLEHEVLIATYGREKYLPTGLRHLVYLIKSLSKVIWADKILVLDTFSVGIPIALATYIFRKPYVIRIGGDFLWELYVERSHEPLPLSDFYSQDILLKLNMKERTVFKLTRFVLSRAAKIAFTTPWLKDIWSTPYSIDPHLVAIVSNALEKQASQEASAKNFLWAGRHLFLKNVDRLQEAFERAKKGAADITLECIQVSREEFKKKLAECYAVVLPSLSEVSPNVIHDAVSYNKPFIVTKYNGLSKDVEDLGFVTEPLSVEDMEMKILELANGETYARMRERIKNAHVERPWSLVASDFLKELSNAK